MSKATRSSLLALAVVAVLAGCSKKDGGTVEGKPAEAPPAASVAQPTAPHPLPAVAAATEVDLTGIARAEGGKTVAEIFAEKDQLAGKQVTVRGKVVKGNANIMGRNWLHVRDGSGAEGTNDVTVTTSAELPEVGTTVVVSGTVATGKDFGMGYVYDVVIEEATLTVE